MAPFDEPPSKAQQCRRNAYYCGVLARAADNAGDRIQLMAMQRGWLALADSEDWLLGALRTRDMTSTPA
ncbi:MAG: hypothetical protein HXY30_02480 [Pseudorhodoplanes sp.]|nr:hypothetical protein [Pseudorhodoplanes sp.]